MESYKSKDGIQEMEESEDGYEFDAAISFAGEDREIAEKLANALKGKGMRVFHDEFYKSNLWGKKLTKHFQEVYGPKPRFVIVLISKYYPAKDWTDFEFSIARREAKERKSEFILPVKLDNTKISGIHEDVMYLDFNREGIDGIVKCFLDKLSRYKTLSTVSSRNGENLTDGLHKQDFERYLENNLSKLISVLDVTDLDGRVPAVKLILNTRECAIKIRKEEIVDKRDWVLLRNNLKEAKKMQAYDTIRNNKNFLNEFYDRLEEYLI